MHPGQEAKIKALNPFMINSVEARNNSSEVVIGTTVFYEGDSAQSMMMAIPFKKQEASLNGVTLQHSTETGFDVSVDADIKDTIKCK